MLSWLSPLCPAKTTTPQPKSLRFRSVGDVSVLKTGKSWALGGAEVEGPMDALACWLAFGWGEPVISVLERFST